MKTTKGKWFLEMSDLTIRCKNFDTSNLMGDYKGNIIADLKRSLGITDEDIDNGVMLSYLDGKGGRQHAFQEVLNNARAICYLVNKINSHEIEPDNEKPYLFYEGEKYYFGEEYEFRKDRKGWYKRFLTSFDSMEKYPFNSGSEHFNSIRKIDHTDKYKKQLQELKEQADKDGVNLKELI